MKKEAITSQEEIDHIYSLLKSNDVDNIKLVKELTTHQPIEWDYRKVMEALPDRRVKFHFEFHNPVFFSRKQLKGCKTAILEVYRIEDGKYNVVRGKYAVPVVSFGHIYASIGNNRYQLTEFDPNIKSVTPIWDSIYTDWYERINYILDILHPNILYLRNMYEQMLTYSLEAIEGVEKTGTKFLPDKKELLSLKKEFGQAFCDRLQVVLDNKEDNFSKIPTSMLDCQTTESGQYIARLSIDVRKRKRNYRHYYAIINAETALFLKKEAR